jgi:hypothetical protein
MAENWQLSAIESIQFTGTDWLLNALKGLSDSSFCMMIMTLWRIWRRNEVVHDKPPPPVETSRRFLQTTWNQ